MSSIVRTRSQDCEVRLRRLHLVYDQLPDAVPQRLYDAIVQLSKGQHPAPVGVGIPELDLDRSDPR